MYLVYVDESGNSGTNLSDPQQPVFALCAMVVCEDRWQGLEHSLKRALEPRFPEWQKVENFEIHGADLRRGVGQFAGMSVADRIAFRDEWMQVGADHDIRLIFRSVHKKAYASWLVKELGKGVIVNPHIVAFAMLSRCVDNYLSSLPGKPLGMLISDENKEIVADVEKSIQVFRSLEGSLRLNQIVEKGFFIDSSKSLPLQLCDLFALSLRKRIERFWGTAPSKPIDDSGIQFCEKILHNDNQHDTDVLNWLKESERSAIKKRPGVSPGSIDTGP